jgi:hypothetical protein
MPADEEFQSQSDHQAYTLIALEYAHFVSVLAELNSEGPFIESWEIL